MSSALRRCVVVSIVATLPLWLFNCAAGPHPVDYLSLPLRDAGSNGEAGPVAGEIRMEPGTEYEVTVLGTFSLWPEEAWADDGTSCPAGASKGVPPTGVDAEYVFARPNPSGAVCQPAGYPQHIENLQFSTNGGGDWAHVEPASTTFNPANVYAYRVVGGGYPLEVRYRDSRTSDNYGRLEVAVSPAVGQRGQLVTPWMLIVGAVLVTGSIIVFPGRAKLLSLLGDARGWLRSPKRVEDTGDPEPAGEVEPPPRALPTAGLEETLLALEAACTRAAEAAAVLRHQLGAIGEVADAMRRLDEALINERRHSAATSEAPRPSAQPTGRPKPITRSDTIDP